MKRIGFLLLGTALVGFYVAGCGKKAQPVTEKPPVTDTQTQPQDTSGRVETGEVSEETIPSGFQKIYFDFDRYYIRDDAKAALENNARVLKGNANMRILIEGHCDERGTVEYNLALGERRAAAARQYLMDLGIEGSRISTISYGKERPVAFGHDESSWQQNRRDEFVTK
ncbi:MAG: peptidoglycan-associated lipoprotein Pal [candidate division Zixibacteria bacterium]|nr:peptidoglycan-associated lipoprotein Pal [candidate division Zixibacteria bacterium]MCI0595549.1 peptidoglycan-associated lipoprotein Pal [candidate division Zixibacteria bacterium]